MENKFLNYLVNDRKLSQDTIQAFELGWYDGNTEYAYYESNNADLSKVKLDFRFVDSILFPIYDLHYNLVGVSARPLVKKGMKYVNTIYSKGGNLYGLWKNWESILEEGKVFVVEGNFDMLSLWDRGIKNVVALLGSALTFEQVCLLVRFTDTIVMVGDGDKAGSTLNGKSKDLCIKNRVKCSVISLPEGIDPDNFIKNNDKRKFLDLIEKDILLCI